MNGEQKTNLPDQSRLLGFWRELRRRKVIRVATVYIVTGWIIIQIAGEIFPSFGIPDWAFRFVALMVLLGLPVAVVLAWALEITPDGIKATRRLDAIENREGESEELAKKRNWTAYAFGALAPTLIFGSLAVFFFMQASRPGVEPDKRAALTGTIEDEQAVQSIAVMPLVNMSSLEENAYFAGGIHEDVLTNLARIENLQVISRTSMLRYAASDLTLTEIGNELGVDYIVEGSVRRIGNHVRVTVQLINARSDVHLWANNYERELTNGFATQSEIAREISDSLHLELQPETVGRLEGMPTASVKAYDLYVRAVGQEKTEGETEQSLLARREMLEQAVVEDPDFVEAWAFLNRVLERMRYRVESRGWFLGGDANRDDVVSTFSAGARRALDRAIALDPDHVETLLSRVVDHNWPKSYEKMLEDKAIFDRILAAYPEHSKAWYHLGWWHSHLDDFPDQDPERFRADAAAAFEEALRLDPFNARMVNAVLDWYRRYGYQEEVTRLANRLNQIIPETANDRKLARVSWDFKQDQIESAFFESADESWIEAYSNGFNAALESDDFFVPEARYWHEAKLAIYNGENDRLIGLADIPIDPERNIWTPIVYSSIHMTAMFVHLNSGDPDRARQLAEGILELEDAIRSNFVIEPDYAPSILARAHAVLGNRGEALRFVDEALETTVSVDGFSIGAMADVDTEAAVEAAFEQLSRNPNWDGFDRMAVMHVWNQAFLTHPRVQEYYVREGKWIDYLAARVPEYSDYANSSTEAR